MHCARHGARQHAACELRYSVIQCCVLMECSRVHAPYPALTVYKTDTALCQQVDELLQQTELN